MFWYNPQVAGGWYIDLPLDHNFPEVDTAWVSMRSSWTNPEEIFVAMKAGKATGHQTRKRRRPLHNFTSIGNCVLILLNQMEMLMQVTLSLMLWVSVGQRSFAKTTICRPATSPARLKRAIDGSITAVAPRVKIQLHIMGQIRSSILQVRPGSQVQKDSRQTPAPF